MSIADLGDLESISVKIQELAKSTKLDKDPEELDQLKRLIKKNVPFTLRGYFSAYLLRELLSNKVTKQKLTKKVEMKMVNPERVKPVQKQSIERPVKEEHKDGKTLYLNIGKIKHLYAKDLAKLLQTELGISREDIYFLKVHDKYSFITMNEENCNKAIEKLNGKEINGRIAQINFSNRKKENKEENTEKETVNE